MWSDDIRVKCTLENTSGEKGNETVQIHSHESFGEDEEMENACCRAITHYCEYRAAMVYRFLFRTVMLAYEWDNAEDCPEYQPILDSIEKFIEIQETKK